ncbi:MAG: hypothetical protein CL943_00805 [Candidatus Diapherotrites archaeon]|uniref:DUF192 domain-containing protein n=1 Tax=Candidatus Iainarchaeum sp. TaxID=3101447 RepID=A0A2D6M092_9ARCH|nr:hypothetical protein [Candidatus Diapherotrites archaeon]
MLFNRKKKKEIMPKVRIASSSWYKLKGLMFENQQQFDYALVFPLPRESIAMATIHMLFVFFPIDVVYLDKNKKVVDIVQNLQPFTPSCSPKKPSKFFIELPVGKSKGISIGDELGW